MTQVEDRIIKLRERLDRANKEAAYYAKGLAKTTHKQTVIRADLARAEHALDNPEDA